MKKFFGHLKTITHHRHLVIKHCFRSGIGFQGLFHDLSKYSPSEFFPGVKYYTGFKSPNEAQRINEGYSSAWMHHKGRNRHHYEYWSDVSLSSKKYEPVEMPCKYVAEMFCDRVAASKVYYKENYTQSVPYEYFMRSADKAEMHPKTRAQIEDLLLYLAQNGEDAAFLYVKKFLKDNKNKN